MCNSVAIIVVVAIKVAQKLLQEDKCDEYVWNLVPPPPEYGQWSSLVNQFVEPQKMQHKFHCFKH